VGASTAISWTDSTWNPFVGCRRVSAGCAHCYAERWAWRWAGPGGIYEGLVKMGALGPQWTGKVSLRRSQLAWPLRASPRRCFVASLSDVFGEAIPDEHVAGVFGIMALAPAWRFQVLTKRPARARALLSRLTLREVLARARELLELPRDRKLADELQRRTAPRRWPLSNVWLGTSVEDQEQAERRLDDLVQAPAVLRFVSAEPLLGPVNLAPWLAGSRPAPARYGAPDGVRWVIVGGESGPGARPMHPAWARALRDECELSSTPYFFKQWGAFAPTLAERAGSVLVPCAVHGPERVGPWSEAEIGRLLDGELWEQVP